MLKRIFDIAYKDMYKKWVIQKKSNSEESNILFYRLPKICLMKRDNFDKVIKEFELYLNSLLISEELQQEFNTQFNKESLFSFIEFIFSNNNILDCFETNKDIFALCYINNILSFLIEEYFNDSDKKEEIIFNNSISNDELISRLYLARKYNKSINYKFDKIGLDSYVYDITNYKMTSYMLLLLFIEKVSFIEGLKSFEEFFKIYKLNNSENRWNIYLSYKLIIDCCRKKYDIDKERPQGLFEEKYGKLKTIPKVETFEESFNLYLLKVGFSLDGIVCSVVNMSNDNKVLSPYKKIFEVEYNKYIDYLNNESKKSEKDMCNYYNGLSKDKSEKKWFDYWKKTGLRPKDCK